MRCGLGGMKRMADGGKRPPVWDARMGGKVPVGPKGIDTVPALTRGGPVMLDSQPGASEYVLTPDMVRALGGAKALDALRAKVHDFGRNARRRAADGLSGYADGGPLLSDTERRNRELARRSFADEVQRQGAPKQRQDYAKAYEADLARTTAEAMQGRDTPLQSFEQRNLEMGARAFADDVLRQGGPQKRASYLEAYGAAGLEGDLSQQDAPAPPESPLDDVTASASSVTPLRLLGSQNAPSLDQLLQGLGGMPALADGGWLGGLFRGARGDRAQQIDRAVDAASAPAPKPATAAPPAEERITPSMADIMRDIRAKHPPIVGKADGGPLSAKDALMLHASGPFAMAQAKRLMDESRRAVLQNPIPSNFYADGGRLPLSGYADGGRTDEERPMLPPPDAYARAAKGSWLPEAARLLSGATVAERGLRGVGDAVSNTGPAATMRGWREQQAAERRAATLEGLKSRMPAGNLPGVNLDQAPAGVSPRYAGGGAPQYDYTPPRQRAALAAAGGRDAAPAPEGQVAGFDRFPGGGLTAYADTKGNSLSFSSPRAGQDVPVGQYQAEARRANPRSGGVSASGIDAQAMGEANKNMREGRRGLGTFSDMRADTRSGGDYFGGVDVSQLSPEQYAQFKVQQMQADNDAQRELRLRKQASPYGEYGAQARATAAAQLQGLSAARAEQQAALSEYQRDVQMERVKGEVQKGVEREKAQAGTQREAPKETRAYLKQVMEGVDAGLEANQDLAAAMTGPGGAEKRGLLESLAGRLHSVFGAEANPSLIAGALQQAIPLLPSRAEAEAAARAELDSGIGGYFSEPSPEAVAEAADQLYRDAWTRVYQQVFGQLTGQPMAVGIGG